MERITSELKHRGPDQSGIFVDREVGLGHRRLSIIDLSEAGRQPMTNEDGNVVVTFNGEIYNFVELRAALERRGHSFRSSSDTEVLVHLWEDRGPAMLDALVGMFAFAIFDRRTRTLFLARDRLGEKPLFWAKVDDGIAFASELAALAGNALVDISLDPAGLAAFLARLYIPAPNTIYRGVRALEPASYAVFEAGREPALQKYWSPRPRAAVPTKEADRRALVDQELTESVRSRMVADVPVGCFLSSGIDSSLVACEMQRAANQTVRTFSIGFEEDGYDESVQSTQTARALGVRHVVEIQKLPTFEVIQGILQRYGQPFGDSSAIPTYLLSRVARQEVTVALSGDGGDEAFGGYERYRLMLLSGSLKQVKALRPLGRALMRSGGASMSVSRVLGRALVVASSTRELAYRSLVEPLQAEAAASPLAPGAHDPFALEDAIFAESRDATLAAQMADLATYLPSCLTTKVDIASMAHSLEVRAPFLDHRLIELGLALPRSERVRLRGTKVLLRRIAADKLGRATASRPKRGFGVPTEVWLRGPMREQARDYLLGRGARLHSVLNRNRVAHDVERFLAGDRSLHTSMWRSLALEAWLRSPMGLRAVP